jgi:hypothetical protein
MSRESLVQIVERVSTDPAFRAQFESDPESALAGYNLTADERAALIRGDENQLRELGVDVRMAKYIPQPTTDTPWPTSPSIT